MNNKIKTIYLAGGCFWGIEAYFSRVKGVVKTTVGYANGKINHDNPPTYKEVCTGETNFAETVLIKYDTEIVSLKQILLHFFNIVDPTTLNRQGNDSGTQYRSGIYFTEKEDEDTIKEIIKNEQQNYSEKIVTEIQLLNNFYDAEEYHQKYLDKNPSGYCHIDLSKISEI